MKFDGMPINYSSQFCGNPALSPLDEIEDRVEIEDFLISSGHGIYIPEIFTQRFTIKGNVPQWAWDTCKKGPDAKDYWEAWWEILDTWEFFEYHGEDYTIRYFLNQKENLCLMREIIND